jgi:hypothetical protein
VFGVLYVEDTKPCPDTAGRSQGLSAGRATSAVEPPSPESPEVAETSPAGLSHGLAPLSEGCILAPPALSHGLGGGPAARMLCSFGKESASCCLRCKQYSSAHLPLTSTASTRGCSGFTPRGGCRSSAWAAFRCLPLSLLLGLLEHDGSHQRQECFERENNRVT